MNNSDKDRKESYYDSNFEDYTGIDAIVIINCSLNVLLMPISILGNALVLAAIFRTPSIHSISMIMLSSLAVSDLLVGLLVQPLFIAKELTEENNIFVVNLSKTSKFLLCGVSLCTMTAITLDRFMAIHYHMRYASLVTSSRVRYSVAFIWLTNFSFSWLHFVNERALNLLTAVVIVICLVISTFSYIRIYLTVRQHQLHIYTQQQAVQSINLGSKFKIARMRKSAISTFIFYIALILCYFPMFVLLNFYGTSKKNWKTEWKFATTLVFMNSSINPFLYCWRLRELRKAVVKITRCMLCKQTGQD